MILCKIAAWVMVWRLGRWDLHNVSGYDWEAEKNILMEIFSRKSLPKKSLKYPHPRISVWYQKSRSTLQEFSIQKNKNHLSNFSEKPLAVCFRILNKKRSSHPWEIKNISKKFNVLKCLLLSVSTKNK